MPRASSAFEPPDSYRYAVHVAAGITHTIGGLRVDERARVLDEDGAPVDGLFAAGADAGGIAAGGYASGLATALVLGLTAAANLASCRYAQTRSSPGRGEGATLHTHSVRSSISTESPTFGASPARSTSS